MTDKDIHKYTTYLNKPTDWVDWLRIIEHKASQHNLWDCINPDKDVYDPEKLKEQGYDARKMAKPFRADKNQPTFATVGVEVDENGVPDHTNIQATQISLLSILHNQ